MGGGEGGGLAVGPLSGDRLVMKNKRRYSETHAENSVGRRDEDARLLNVEGGKRR